MLLTNEYFPDHLRKKKSKEKKIQSEKKQEEKKLSCFSVFSDTQFFQYVFEH